MQLPDDPALREITDALVAELERTLGNRFVGLFQYGAACFPPSPVCDFDAHVLVSEPFDDADRRDVTKMLGRLDPMPYGDELDVWYVTVDAAQSSKPPRSELRPELVDHSWALHRAHVHAGRFVQVKGPDPRSLLPEPTWEELDEALQGELDYIGRHIPDAPAFCVLNLCRILYSYEARDVVTSKLLSALWAFAYLDAAHHELIRNALRAYATKTYAIQEDIRPFHQEMSTRIVRARRRG